MKCKVFTFLSVFIVVTLGIAFFSSKTFRVEASFTSPLTINFSYPIFPSPVAAFRIGGTGTEQVFRSGSVPATGVFAGLDPKNGVAPVGTSLQFFVGSVGAIGANDFVYAMKIQNLASSTLPMSTFQAGSCSGTEITSIGFVQDMSGAVFNPTDGAFFSGVGQLFFTFENSNVIPPGQESTILFFTSPNPPSLATSFIGGGSGANSVSANIDPNQRLYTPCPVSLVVDKKIGCAPDTVADTPLQAVVGSPIVYKINVQNTGGTPLSNLIINDPLLGGNINSLFTVNGNQFTGDLLPGQTAMATIPSTATANVSNTVMVTGDYAILTQQGIPTGQTFPLLESPDATLSDVVQLTTLPPPNIQPMMTVSPTSFTTLPQTLTYTLKATNNGTETLSTVLDVDSKLKAILTSPPPGLALVGPPSFPTAAQTLTAGQMTQIQFGITVLTTQGWLALADAGLTTSTFTMTAAGTLAASTPNTCGTRTDVETASATTSFTPPCAVAIEKTVACDTDMGVPPDAEFSPTVLIYPGAKIYYRYKVTNPNLISAVSNITITDPTVNPMPINVGTLAAGEMRVINVLVTGPQTVGSLVGTATVTGTCDGGTVSAQSTTTVQVVEPKISAEKLVNGAAGIPNYQLGTELKYTLSATNDSTSGTPLNLTIDDPLLRAIPGIVIKDGNTTVSLPYTFNMVQPGQTVTLTASITFNTEQEYRAVSDSQYLIRNTMQVKASIPGGVAACSLGANIPTLSATAQADVQYNPPGVPEVCIIKDCEPNCPLPTPGFSLVPEATPSIVAPGSLLVYNIYTSTPSASEDTGLTLTNVGPKTVFVHLFLVDGRTCSVTDFFSCLSPNQTSFWLASELDPGITGYMIGVATDNNGLPISFNFLRGTSKVKFSSGHSAVLPALSFSALFAPYTVLPGVNLGSTTADLRLDGNSYSLAPQMLAVSNLASPAESNSSLLILNPLGGDLNSGDPVGLVKGLTGQVLDDKERGYSFIIPTNTCQVREILREGYPRIPTGLSKIIPAGATGALRFSEVTGTPLMGSIINFNPNVKTSSRAFNQGHNLHHLTYTDKGVYTIPILRPSF